jgi:hypothetical protein
MEIKSDPIANLDITNKIIVLREDILSTSFRSVGDRLYRALSGFGCHPATFGKAVFAECLGDGEKARWERDDFEGWVTEEEAQKLLTKERIMGQLI